MKAIPVPWHNVAKGDTLMKGQPMHDLTRDKRAAVPYLKKSVAIADAQIR